MRDTKNTVFVSLGLAAAVLFTVTGCGTPTRDNGQPLVSVSSFVETQSESEAESEIVSGAKADETAINTFRTEDIPSYAGEAYAVVHDNIPYFTEDEITDVSFEDYTPLDELGRCGAATASVSLDTMPTEKRGSIGQVKPSGWHTVKYDWVDGKYLYNRCHLIGYQLTAENANERNLITGTRSLNIDGMLPFENMVADYVKETENHVMYRVTPVFDGNNLVADGVLMEGYSVEDTGDGVTFCVFAYNVEPGVEIDYATGDSWASNDNGANSEAVSVTSTTETEEQTYILNTGSKKFHKPECSGAEKISDANKQSYTGTRDTLIAEGYDPCGICKP